MVGFFRSPAAPAINFSSSLNIIFLKIFSKCFFASCSADSYCQLTSQSTLKYLICYAYSLFQLDHRTIRSWKSIPYKQNFAVVVSGFSQVQNLRTQLWFWTGIGQTHYRHWIQTWNGNRDLLFRVSCMNLTLFVAKDSEANTAPWRRIGGWWTEIVPASWRKGRRNWSSHRRPGSSSSRRRHLPLKLSSHIPWSSMWSSW